MQISKKRSFSTFFLIEMWERFGFYGMAGIMVLYMVDGLNLSEKNASLIWGAFSSLLYAAPLIGGWLGDKILGARRSMFIGTGFLLLGYIILSLPFSGKMYMMISMSVICVGYGFFKVNAANLVRKIYEDEPARLDGVFTMYYMAVNVGSTVSILLTPIVKEYYGWHYAFVICAFGMLFAVLQAAISIKTISHLGNKADEKKISWRRWFEVLVGVVIFIVIVNFLLKNKDLARTFVYIAGIVGIVIFIGLILKASASGRAGLIAAFLLIVQTMFFMVFYQQMSTSLTLFALHNVDPHFYVLGHSLFTFTAAQYQAFNPIFIIVFSPILAAIYAKTETDPSKSFIAHKFALGFFAVMLGFAIFAGSGYFAENGLVSSWFMVAGYFLYSLGEMLVSAIGVSMIARYAPTSLGAMMQGLYSLSVGISFYLGSIVATYASAPSEDNMTPDKTLGVYTHLFTGLTIAAFVALVIAVFMIPLLKRLSDTHAKGYSGISS